MVTQVALQATSTATVALPLSHRDTAAATATLTIPTVPTQRPRLSYPGLLRHARRTPHFDHILQCGVFRRRCRASRTARATPTANALPKTWDVRNIGTCTWSRKYKLVFNGGKHMDGPNSVALPGGGQAGRSPVPLGEHDRARVSRASTSATGCCRLRMEPSSAWATAGPTRYLVYIVVR